MTKKRILYITYVDENFVSSGSGVRPAKMLKAFQEEGHDVVVLSGAQNRKVRSVRIKRVIEELSINKPDLCYIESPTYPIMLHEDRKLIKNIHNAGIPIGYFYRDFYRKFPTLFPRRKGVIGSLKEYALDYLQYRTDKVLEYCDIIYVPSDECRSILNYKDIRSLPPAGENKLIRNRKPNHTVIYVGGISEHYGGNFLLDVFNELYQRSRDYKLILVCREEEWNKFSNPYGAPEWLEVHHVSGDKKLAPLYAAAAAAAAGKSQNVYNEFAVSVKTFEYLSYGLPQIVVRSRAIERIISQEKIGFAVEQDVKTFADKFEYLLDNPDLYDEFQKNIETSLLTKNLWIHRVRKVIEDLSSDSCNN